MIQNRILKLICVLAVSLSALFFATEIHAQDAKAGKATFRSKCGSCHDVSLKQNSTGPALAGVIDRWNAAGAFKGKSGEEWLKSWIINWNDPVNAGMPYAVKMKDFSTSQMSVFAGQLSDAELGNILAYIKNPESVTPKKDDGGTQADTGAAPAKNSETTYMWIAGIVLLLLLLNAFFLGGLTRKVNQYMAEKEGKILPAEEPFLQSKKFKAFLIVASLMLLGYALMKNAIDLGRSQGYQPVQPIRYSHALHAGKHKIDCQYCHSSASKGKHSNIPSINVCMNCHKNVQEGPKYGKTEIAKIYKAADYNPETQTYGGNPQPVEWVRIHNLPDHVNFNHSVHVKSGKVACQTCHGPIEEMEEVYQYAPLSMGWCVNCHRNHEVQFTENGYYKVYEKYHQEMKEGKRTRVTVSDIGGAECQKCHY